MATLNQEKAVKDTLDNLGKGKKVSMGKILRKNGYSESVIKNPKIVTESVGWQELMEKHLPDKLLAQKHKELLTVPKKVRQFVKGELTSEYEELDSNAVKSGLDMAYKLKGKYAAEKHEVKVFTLEELFKNAKSD